MTDKVTTRLRKLIRLGESPDENEAQNALRMAAELAAKYHLDLATISTEADDGSALGQRKSDVVLWGARQRKYRWQLAHVVARAWGCAPWVISRRVVTLETAPSENKVREVFESYLATHERLGRRTSFEIREHGELAQVVVSSVFGKAPSDLYMDDFDGIIKSELSSVLAMFGRRDAADAAIYSYHVLLQAVDSIAKRVASGRSGVNDARYGLVFGLSARLDELFGEGGASDEGYAAPDFDARPKSTALVLTEARDEAERFLSDCYGDENKKPYSGGADFEAKDEASFTAGLHAAAEIEIPDPSSGRTSLGGSHALPMGEDRQLA